MKLVYISLLFVLGIYSGSYFYVPPGYGLVIIAALPFIAVAIQITKRALHIRRVGIATVVVACIIAFLLGATRFAAVPSGDDLQRYVGQDTVSVTGVIRDEPESANASVKLILSVKEVDGEPASGTMLVRTARYPTFQYGDLLNVTGELELPPDNLNGFQYRTYLESQGIYTSMFFPNVELIAEGQGPQPLQAIHSLRHSLGESLRQSLPEPESSLARGILLGLRGDIPDSLNEAFQLSGTTHILAISGQNMAIIAGIVLSIASRIFGKRRPTYFIITLAVLWIYALLAGLSSPVLRAVIMVSVYLLGIYLGRQSSGLTAVAFSASVMIAVNPKILWQISFQLSFAAVIGLMVLTPAIQDWLARARMPRTVAESLAVGLGAILATLPLTAYYFGYTSLVTLPATFFASLVLPAVIVITAIVAIAGLVWMPGARVVAWIDWLLLKYFILVVQGFAAIPHASVTISQVKPWLIYTYYGLLAAIRWLFLKLGRRFPREEVPASVIGFLPMPTKMKWCVASLTTIAVMVWAVVFTGPDRGDLRVSFIDVGQGDSILISSPSCRYVLIDGGTNPEKTCLALGEALPFWEHRIDMVVMTHPHDDHANGLVDVVKRYDVGQALLPLDRHDEYTSGDLLPGSMELMETLESNGIECVRARAGQIIYIGGGAVIEVLNPQAIPYEGTDSDVDNNGVVLRVSMSEISFLLAADLYWDGELRMVCERAALDSTVLKACHHGSKSSSRPYWLEAVSPQAAVISVGADNNYGHPNTSVVERLSDTAGEELVFLTSERGTITFTTDGERLWVETKR